MTTVIISAVTLGLAWFAALNAAASVVAWMLSTLFDERHVGPDVRRSRWLLAIRFLPFTLASTVSLGLFVPAHLKLEPAQSNEEYGVLVLLCAAAACLLLTRSLWRAAGIVAGSRCLAEMIRERPEREHAAWIELPVMHGVALAGVFRPRVLVGASTRRALSAEELDIALAHELAHRDAYDNLTRALMRCVPDFLGFTAASGRIERLWDGHAECLADARAANGSRDRAARLASALVKIAKLRAPAAPQPAAWSTFHQPALLERRVRLLVEAAPEQVSARSPRFTMWIVVSGTIVAGWALGIPSALHRFTELAIALLP